jgi:hypothetical protein
MPNYNPNMLDQRVDVGGSPVIDSAKILAEELSQLGQGISGGSAAALSSTVGSTVTITGLSGITGNSVGNFITLSGSSIPGNNGTFPIVQYISGSSLTFTNAAISLPDPSSISWVQRLPYSLQDDINFERTDREAIKGVGFSFPVPIYQRPTATSTDVPANLLNIASKTTDARGFIVNRKFYNVLVSAGDQQSLIVDTGNLKHSDAIDKTGVPCFNTAPYSGNYQAAYAELLDGYTDAALLVLSGPHIGEKIFALTEQTLSVSPNSIDVVFYSCPIGSNVSTSSTLYTWETGQSSKITCIYGFFQRLDLLSDEALRVSLAGGGGGATQQPRSLLTGFMFGGM